MTDAADISRLNFRVQALEERVVQLEQLVASLDQRTTGSIVLGPGTGRRGIPTPPQRRILDALLKEGEQTDGTDD